MLAKQEADRERQRADREQERSESVEQRAELLAAKLRDLGINVDGVL